MKIFNKTTPPPAAPAAIVRRASKMQTHDLHLWCDSLIMELGRTFDDWNKDRSESEDVDLVLDSINALWKELKNRA